MKRIALVALALLSACSTSRPPVAPPGEAQRPPTAPTAWLVGGWVVAEDGSHDRSACDGDSGVVYRADGSFETLEQSGRWTLDGNTLRTRIEASDDNSAAIGKTETARIEAAGADEARLHYADGDEATLLRCPNP